MSSITTDEDIVDHWIEIDDSISVADQTLDEILADKIIDFDEELSGNEDDESLITTHYTCQPLSSLTYSLDSPLALNKLESLSYQMLHCDRKSCGRASAISVSNVHIAIGTNRGLVLIFSREIQRLEHSLSSGNCPVSCLDFNGDGSKLAIGYGSGLLRVFSIPAGKIIEEVKDAIQPGRGILQIAFFSSGKRLIVVDSGGSVYEIKMGSVVRRRKILCLFSGCHGEVVYIKFLAGDQILALLSLRKVFLLHLREMRLIFSSAISGPANCPPLLDWQFVESKVLDFFSMSNRKIVGFCVLRGSQIEFFTIDDTSVPIKIMRTRSLILAFDAINVKWIEPHCLIAIDANEKAHLVDTLQGEISEATLTDIELVYGTADFKGHFTGGNVSAALSFMANSVCYQSLYRKNNLLYVLGQSSVYIISVKDQIAQLDELIERNELLSAVLYAIDIFKGKVGNKSRVGKSNVRRPIFDRLPSLIRGLLSLTIAGMENGKIVHLIDHYKKYIHILIYACVTTSQFDLLYDTVYSCLEKDSLSKMIFLECIDEVVLDGNLENPPPSLVSDYFHHLVGEGCLNQFEASVVRIPIDRQDIHFVMTVCRKNQLYDGIIYVYNKAFEDYISPLEEMFDRLAEFIDSEVFSDCEITCGNKLLLYVQCCLSGKAYPLGALPSVLAQKLPIDVYRCLISVKGKDGSYTKADYPYLRLLIKFDALQFFNVIFTCSDSEVFNFDDRRLQRLIEVIYRLISIDDSTLPLYLNFLTLLIHLLQKKMIVPSLEIFTELIEIIMSINVQNSQFYEADQLIVEALRLVNGIDELKILEMARRRPHLQVCAYIYTSRREFISLIDCYIGDRENARSVFTIIKILMNDLKNQELSDFMQHIEASILELARIDHYQTAELVLDYFMNWLKGKISDETDAYLLYYNCFLSRRERGYRTLLGDDDLDEKLFVLAVEGYIKQNLSQDLDKELAEQLRYWLNLAARTDRCLNLTVTYHLIGSCILLLEERRLIDRAFEVLDCELDKIWKTNKVLMSKYIQEITRLATTYRDEAKKSKWLFKMLCKILALNESWLDQDPEVVDWLNSIITAILEIGGSDLEKLIDTLFGHPLFSGATYVKFRSLILSVLENCKFESVILQSTVLCIENEIIETLSKVKKLSTCRVSNLIRSNICVVCEAESNKSSILFSCGHMMHLDCESQDGVRQCPCSVGQTRSRFLCDTANAFGQNQKKPKTECIFNEETMRLNLSPNRHETFG